MKGKEKPDWVVEPSDDDEHLTKLCPSQEPHIVHKWPCSAIDGCHPEDSVDLGWKAEMDPDWLAARSCCLAKLPLHNCIEHGVECGGV